MISEIDANPKKIKPKGINLFLLKCLNLLIDLVPNNIGMIAAWKCANNKIEKNKINSKICLENLHSLENIENRRNDIEVICKDVLKWTKPNYDRNLSSRNIDLNKLKFDFVYLDPPYEVDFHELVLNQLFNCNFLKKDSTVICEHSPNLFIKKSNIWQTIDVRDYGQSRLTFLINVQHPWTSSVLIPCTYK